MPGRFNVSFTRSAAKEFGRLPRSEQRRFAEAISMVEADPHRRRSGVDILRLSGGRNTWRLRVGRYRDIYEIEGGTVVFTRFGHRSSIYDTP
jgi:mRNA-degrading endonuclease RelE of RelBE toxin-antitoxin system